MALFAVGPRKSAFTRGLLLSGSMLGALMPSVTSAQEVGQTGSPEEAAASASATSSTDVGVPEANSDIVVTATRRATAVQDTPISVAVTTGESLQRYDITDVQSLTRLEPALVVNNAGVASNQFIIRGIVSDVGATTGFYFDEAPLVGGRGSEGLGDGKPGLRLHDIERVEVLKGPQGTLFGSGSMAGTLRIITNRPTLGIAEGGVSTSVGFVDGGDAIMEANAFINVPISSTLALRAVGWGEWGGGYIDQEITTLDGSSTRRLENVNDRELFGGRLSLLFKPTDNFSVLLSAANQTIEVNGLQSWNLDADPFISTSPTTGRYEDSYQLYTTTMNYEIEAGTFSLIGSYGRQKSFNAEDTTPTGLGLAGPFRLLPFKTSLPITVDFEDYTAEARFSSSLPGPFQFIVGAFYQRDKLRSVTSAVRANDISGVAACYSLIHCVAANRRQPGFSARGVPASDLLYEQDNRREVRQWAVYGQADYQILDTLTATAGIRFYSARIHDVSIQVQDIAGPPDFVVPVPVPSWAANGRITTPYVTQDDRARESSPSYNFSLMWEATRDLSVFARAASGFRIGGTNDAASLAGQAGIQIPQAFDSDDLWSYEVGLKAYFLDRRLFLDTSIYQLDWTNQQLGATDPSGAFEYTLNAGHTRIRGAELSLRYNTPSGFSFGGGVTYTNATLTRDLDPEVIDAGTIGFSGDRLPRVPRWTAAGSIGYETEVSSGTIFYAQGDANYRSSSTFSFNDQNVFNPRLPAFLLLGARVGVRWGPTDISLFAENITNKAAIYGIDASPDGLRAYSPTPRTIGARLQARF
jgi:iron complex outermembrane receptor protein